jgi:hypothetical protein
MAGYSTTPLAKKLGIKSGFSIRLINAPAHYHNLFDDWPNDVIQSTKATDKKDFIHYFSTNADKLNEDMKLLKDEIKSTGMIWISWPKKSCKVSTDITEDVVRQIGLKSGLVDVKVCAIDETWSGLKFVIRVKDRK